jgi:hypothetical protein
MMLFQLINEKNISQFKSWVDVNPLLLSETNLHGFTPLMFSLHTGRLDFAEHCLKYGHKNKLGQRDWSGRQSTALHFAATNGYFDIVTKIIKLGHNIKDYDGLGHSASSLSYKHGHKNIGQFLDGLWFKYTWKPILYKTYPPDFQEDVKILLLVLKRWENEYNLKFYKDLKYLIINKLLSQHKAMYQSSFKQILHNH